MKRTLSVVFLFLYALFTVVQAQNTNADSYRLALLAKKAIRFSKDYTQEKVYLHFDNTGYYLGETIWFKAYVVKAENNAFSDMSKTLYVDLLTAEGEVLETKKLPVKDGACHGEFALRDSLKAGFYEVRAYTRCMMNFGQDVIFSRVFPVYDAPETEGKYQPRIMSPRPFTIPNEREKEAHLDKINVSFFPEGGNMVVGIESKIAFKATDQNGQGIAMSGVVYNAQGEEVTTFESQHLGMGFFPLFPDGKKYTAKVTYNGKVSRFDLPLAEKTGYVLTTFNLNDKALRAFVQKSATQPDDSLAIVLTCRGKIYDFKFVKAGEEGQMLTYNKTQLPTGVYMLSLYDPKGAVLCERMVFIQQIERALLTVTPNKETYEPFDPVGMTIQASNPDGSPLETSFSMAVRDGATSNFGHADCGNIQTNLLLSSDLKGFIENPGWYFATQTPDRKLGLDLLMMVQGWHRYSWKQAIGSEPFKGTQPIEEGILIDGKVLSLLAKKEKKNIDVSFWMIRGDQSYKGQCTTDEDGNFNFLLDMMGTWDMSLQTKNEDKRKEYRILLNRAFAPNPRAYHAFDRQIWENQSFQKQVEVDSVDLMMGETKPTEIATSNPEGYKEYKLREVVKTQRKALSIEQKAARNASVNYNVGKITDKHRDIGESQATDILQMLEEENKYFSIFRKDTSVEYRYKGRPIQFLYNNTHIEYIPSIKLEELLTNDIERVMIVEDREVGSFLNPSAKSDVPPVCIFLYSFRNGKRQQEPIGIRKTTFEGYAQVREFYHPVYRPNVPKPDDDFRRTLYWNPDVQTDSTGKATLKFFNNSTCRKMTVSAEGVTENGVILQTSDLEKKE